MSPVPPQPGGELPKEGGEDPAMAALERMELMGLKYIKGDFG